jgi:hypothetical protein
MAYCSLEDVENYLLIEVEESFQAQVESWISDMEEFIEMETGRDFEADTVASDKKYEIVKKDEDEIGRYKESVQDIHIDECIEVDSLEIDDSAVDSDDYITYPANSLPITRIHLTDESGEVFTEGEQNIVVSAKWGYSESPPREIKFACIVLVAGIINNAWSSEGEVSSMTMGRYTVSFKDEKQLKDFEQVKRILEKYKKPTL